MFLRKDKYRVIRGFSWRNQDRLCCAAARENDFPDFSSISFGLRVAMGVTNAISERYSYKAV